MSAEDSGQEDPTAICNLQSLHQTALSRIRGRHAALSERVEVWDQYRSALAKFLAWLDAAEREKKRRLEVRRLQEHSLPTATHRVDVMLDKLGQGEALQAEVERYAAQLLERLGAEDSAITVRADLKSASGRLRDLEAWLCTWRDFLQRVSRLYHSLDRGIEAIRMQLQSVQNDLVTDQVPTSYEEAAQLLQTYRVSFPVHCQLLCRN